MTGSIIMLYQFKAISASVVYVILSQLGNPSTLTSNTQRTSYGHYGDNVDRLGNTDC